jgi:L-threonylcarbamoyladenylate synthase
MDKTRPMPLCLLIDPSDPDPAALRQAANVLRQGGVVAYPTETLYGLGVSPFDAQALEKLYCLKGRPATLPISILVRDLDMLREVVLEIPPLALRLARAFLPGPLTLVLPASPSLPARVTAGSGKVGVRISSHPLAGPLFGAYPSPITTTSANPTGRPGARTAGEVKAYFPEDLDCILDGGGVPGGPGSTVVDVSADRLVVLREGAIPLGELQEYL